MEGNLEKRVEQLEKEVAELKESIQPENLAAAVSKEIAKSLNFTRNQWNDYIKNVSP
jgi:hypothetical protein